MTDTTLSHVPAPIDRSSPMPLGRVFRAYAVEAWFEILRSLRTIGFAGPFLIIPAVTYFLFGVLMLPAEAEGELGSGIANYLFCSFSTMAVIMPGIFGGCIGLAFEREGGLLKLKRALPMPPGASLIAKIAMSTSFAAAAVTILAVVALLAGKVTLTGAQVAIIWSVMVLGTIPFCAIGFFIGSISSGSAVPAYGNLVLLPMLWLSGLFIPLPAILRPWVIVWPAFHLNQVAIGLAGLTEYRYFPTTMAIAVLVGVTVLFGGAAIYRLARVG